MRGDFQASLALIGCAAAVAAWLSGAGPLSLATAVLIGSVVPFTLIVVKSVNDVLLGGGAVGSEVNALLVLWGHLHWARTVTSGAAFIVCLVDLFRRA